MKPFLLDTNVFDALLDEGITPAELNSCGRYIITRIQVSELKNIPDEGRREKLLELLNSIEPQKIALNSGVWLDDLHWDDDQPWRDEIGPDCGHFVSGKQNKPWKDALIGEVAKHHDLILISKDVKFLKRAEAASIDIMPFDAFLSCIRSSSSADLE